MLIDGRSAGRQNRTYGVFKVGVDLLAGRTNTLGYTVWMPQLDTANAVSVASPTTNHVVITNPSIPGLELHLPPQTVIRDTDGQTVFQISMTPIPTNQPPFPLPPGVNVPVYFTIQPGGSQVIPPRARLIYPNFMNLSPGARVDFYNYDATGKGWYVYGKGTVTPDRRQIVPDAGVVLYEFSGAMIASPSSAPPEGPPPGSCCRGGDPVDLSTGLFLNENTDLALADSIAVTLTRTYRQRDTLSRAFGIGSSHPYEMFLVGDTFPYTFLEVILPDGGRVRYTRISAGTSYSDAVYEHTSTPTTFYKSTIGWNGNGWDLKLKNGTTYIFPEAFGAGRPAEGALTGIRDRYGNMLTLEHDGLSNLTKIITPMGAGLNSHTMPTIASRRPETI
jgi:YD repeat-containing protein